MDAGRHGALPCRAAREKEKRAGICQRWDREQCTSGCPVSKCQERCVQHPGIQVLVLATRTYPGLLLSKALGARPGVPNPFCWEEIWEAYLNDLKLAPVSQGLRDFMARRKRCGQCRQSVTRSVNVWLVESEKSVRFCSFIYLSCLIRYSFGPQAPFSSQKKLAHVPAPL